MLRSTSNFSKICVSLCLFFSSLVLAQHVISVEDIIKMTKAGLSEDIIIQQIQRSPRSSEVTADQLIQMKTASVSDAVIRAMVSVPSANGVAAPAKNQPTSADGFPTDSGVYVKQHKTWTEVLPEIVNWKTGGVVKSLATAGVVKGDLNGHINGSASHMAVSDPVELLIVTPDGVAITEYQLLHLRQNSGNREFRTVTGGVFHVSSGATRDIVDFTWNKVAPRTYSVQLHNISRGEYGLLSPGAVIARNAAGSSGKIHTFTIIE